MTAPVSDSPVLAVPIKPLIVLILLFHSQKFPVAGITIKKQILKQRFLLIIFSGLDTLFANTRDLKQS